MSVLNRMTGIPWHVEKYTRQEGDDRRHRSRCIYYDKKEKHCSKTYSVCYGASHCNYYDELYNDEIDITPVPVKEDKNTQDFIGIQMLSMDLISVDKKKFKLPSQDKIDAVIDYYNQHGKLDKPISVSCKGDKYWLEDKYLRYYVAKKMGLKEIPAKIGTEKQNKIDDKLRIVGTRCKHMKFGNGQVTEVLDNKIVIRFESGKEVTFDIDFVVSKNLIKLR